MRASLHPRCLTIGKRLDELLVIVASPKSHNDVVRVSGDKTGDAITLQRDDVLEGLPEDGNFLDGVVGIYGAGNVREAARVGQIRRFSIYPDINHLYSACSCSRRGHVPPRYLDFRRCRMVSGRPLRLFDARDVDDDVLFLERGKFPYVEMHAVTVHANDGHFIEFAGVLADFVVGHTPLIQIGAAADAQ